MNHDLDILRSFLATIPREAHHICIETYNHLRNSDLYLLTQVPEAIVNLILQFSILRSPYSLKFTLSGAGLMDECPKRLYTDPLDLEDEESPETASNPAQAVKVYLVPIPYKGKELEITIAMPSRYNLRRGPVYCLIQRRQWRMAPWEFIIAIDKRSISFLNCFPPYLRMWCTMNHEWQLILDDPGANITCL